MKIVYLHQYFTTPDMPGGTRSHLMGAHLVRAGHEVHMVSAFRDPTARRGSWRESVDGIEVHWIPVRYSNYMGFWPRVRAFLEFAWKSARLAASIPADLVVATSTPLTIALPGAYAAWRQQKPMVFEVRDLWPDLPIAVGSLHNPVLIGLARWIERLAYHRSVRVIALSPGIAEGVIRAGYPRERVAIVPNACDRARFQEARGALRDVFPDLPVRAGDRLVLYAGTLGRINGVTYLVKLAAHAMSLAPHVKFLIVGDGAERRLVEGEGERLGVLNKTLFLRPPVEKRTMPRVLAGCDLATSLFIDLPEMWNNSANKFFDALAAGRAVLINYSGWQAELLRRAGAGLVVPPDDPAEAARMLVAFLADPSEVQRAGRAAERLARDTFDGERLGKRFVHLLEDAATAPRPRVVA